MDFDKFALLPTEIKLLKQLAEVPAMNLGANEPAKILRLDLVSQLYEETDSDGFPIYHGDYQITDQGIRFLNYLSKKKKEKISSEFRGWATTIIAIAAFIKSFFF